jgi:membrane-associated phospholipid phosphatase
MRLSPTLVGLASAFAVVPLSIAFFDRPVADYAHAHFHDFREFTWGLRQFVWLTRIAEPIFPLAVSGLVGAGIAAARGWRPGPRARSLIGAGLAVLLAVVLTRVFKLACGRTWPETWVHDNPSWIRDGVFGFFPFHGGAGWASFPSGHTSVTAAPAAALWSGFPRYRPVLLAPVLLVAIGLIGADYHFLGDVLGGAYLGTACGLGAVYALNAPKRS